MIDASCPYCGVNNKLKMAGTYQHDQDSWGLLECHQCDERFVWKAVFVTETFKIEAKVQSE